MFIFPDFLEMMIETEFLQVNIFKTSLKALGFFFYFLTLNDPS